MSMGDARIVEPRSSIPPHHVGGKVRGSRNGAAALRCQLHSLNVQHCIAQLPLGVDNSTTLLLRRVCIQDSTSVDCSIHMRFHGTVHERACDVCQPKLPIAGVSASARRSQIQAPYPCDSANISNSYDWPHAIIWPERVDAGHLACNRLRMCLSWSAGPLTR